MVKDDGKPEECGKTLEKRLSTLFHFSFYCHSLCEIGMTAISNRRISISANKQKAECVCVYSSVLCSVLYNRFPLLSISGVITIVTRAVSGSFLVQQCSACVIPHTLPLIFVFMLNTTDTVILTSLLLALQNA